MDAASASPTRIWDVRSPRDGQVVASVPFTSIDSLPAIVARAREAQPAWAALSMKERVRRFGNIRDRWLERANDLSAALQKEGGKSEIEALMSEVVPTVALFNYWMKAGPGFLAREKVALSPLDFPGKSGYIDYEPRGVVALITPWNYPASIPIRTLVPALLAGNAVVWKPSEYGMLVGQIIADIFAADLPLGLLGLVQGDGQVGAALVACGVNLVSFTGSVATGKRIAVSAAERFLPVALELGGKNAAIVLDDADLDRASAGIVWGAFANGGQNCAAVARVYVVESVASELEKRIRARTAQLKFGNDAGPLYDVGPLINDRQLARVTGQLDEAKAASTKLWSGGGRSGEKGCWVEPTILESPAAGLSIAKEETFGPAVSITVVKDETEAVRLANDSEYGLTASVWTRDLTRGERIAHALDVGAITVNNTSFTPVIPNAPWAGRKASGTGCTNSHKALHEMVQTRFVLLDKSKGGELWWFPHDQQLLNLARNLIGFLSSKFWTKLSAIPKVLPLMSARQKALSKPVL